MQTRSKGLPLEPIDLEIEASNRRRGGQRRRATVERAKPVINFFGPMENLENNDIPPPPLNYEEIILQLKQEMDEMKEERDEERKRQAPVQNAFTNVDVRGPPIDPKVDANNFELMIALIQMVQQNTLFGKAAEDPNMHISKFLEIANTTKLNGVPEDTIKLRLFPFSLVDDAKDWYDGLAPGSVLSWEDLSRKFLEKFFPYNSTLKLQAEITQFSMMGLESMYEAWKRFNSLLRRCPNHGIGRGQLVSIFYNGCTDQYKSQLDFGSRGSFFDLGIEECEKMLERLAVNSKSWSSGRDNSARVAAAGDIDPINLLAQQMLLLNKKVDNIHLAQAHVEPQAGIEDVNYVHQGGHQSNYNNNYRSNQGGGNYQANHSHPNLSYENPNNAIQPPPGFSVSNGAINEPNNASSNASTNDPLKAFMDRTENYMAGSTQRLDKVETAIVEVNTRMKMLETQMNQIAQAVNTQHMLGHFPGQPNVNPKDCKAVHVEEQPEKEDVNEKRKKKLKE